MMCVGAAERRCDNMAGFDSSPLVAPMNLEVHIQDPGRETKVLTFSQSPIRIGRNQLNDVLLDDRFVSEWHGIIRFDDRSVAYFDLGSTNGSVLDGKRLAKNVPAALNERSRLVLGRLQIQVFPRRDGAGVPTTGPRRDSTGPVKTLAWGVKEATTPSDASSPAPPGSGSETSASLTPGDAPAGPGRPARGGLPTPPARPAIAWPDSTAAALFGGAPPSGDLSSVPPAGGPAATAKPSALGGFSNVPNAPNAGSSGRLGSAGPLAYAAGGDLVGPPAAGELGSADGGSASGGREAKILEAFCEAFVGLRKGYEQFGSEVGVRIVSGSTPFHRARSSRELLDHLLDSRVDPKVVLRELIAVFADLGIHHIALMEGITESVRAVLQSLDPRANDLDAGSRLFTGSKIKHQWKSYLDRFEHLVTDDNELHAAIFGEEFARAYASVTLGDRGPSDRGDDD